MSRDTLGHLPNDILHKVDRAAMGVSLETRVPFPDHRVIELDWRLPQHMKIRNAQRKWLLRKLLYKHVPRDLIESPKRLWCSDWRLVKRPAAGLGRGFA